MELELSLKLGFCRAEDEKQRRRGSADPPEQLNLLLPAHHLPGFSREIESSTRKLESEDSMDLSAAERSFSKVSDEEENGGGRKKLRLSKEQSAFLEENFKEHSTLKPKQKSALAKQLNLRPRQVEVWFQNRRARTKLKQTEVDCDYLKRCCEALTEENRRLHKEISELRALKASHPFYAQLPATTLSICVACERAAKSTGGGSGKPAPFNALFAKTRFNGFSNTAPAAAHHPSAAS